MKLSLLLLIGVEARRRLRTNRDCFDLDTTDDLNGYKGSDFERIAGKLNFVEFWPKFYRFRVEQSKRLSMNRQKE